MRKIKVNYVPLYFADFLADLLLMSPDVGGAYCRLCFTIYKESGTVPNDQFILSQICGFNEIEFANKIWPNLKHKFIIKKGYITHKRCTKELKKAQQLLQVRKKAGLTGAQKRWQTHSKRIAKPMRSQCEGNGNNNKTNNKDDIYINNNNISNSIDTGGNPPNIVVSDSPSKPFVGSCGKALAEISKKKNYWLSRLSETYPELTPRQKNTLKKLTLQMECFATKQNNTKVFTEVLAILQKSTESKIRNRIGYIVGSIKNLIE